MKDFENFKENMINLGEEALKNVIDTKPRLRASTLNENFVVEYARKGENYFSNNPIRLMVVGRVAGLFGKSEDGKFAKHHLSTLKNNNGKWEVDKEQIERCFKEYYEKDNMDWIHHERDNVKGRRHIDSKHFFRFAKMVYLKLTEQDQDFEWYKNICNSNIYKIISPVGGNPTWAVIKRQEKTMAKIMKLEFEFFEPTHILVMDGENESCCWCNEIKEDLRRYAENIGAKICFCNRPEVNKSDELMETVKKDFNL